MTNLDDLKVIVTSDCLCPRCVALGVACWVMSQTDEALNSLSDEAFDALKTFVQAIDTGTTVN